MKMEATKRALDKIYKRRDRYEIPDWQREEVWDKAKKQGLIDSILRGWTLPKFYVVKVSDDPEEYEVADGQQRLTTIFEFFDNELPLADSAAKEFGGPYYRDLDATRSDAFDDFEIQIDVITDGTDEEIKDFFQRLQAGFPLTSSEKLNAVHSDLRDFIKKLSTHPFLKNKVALTDKRYAHFDIAAKVAAVEIEGLWVSLRFEDLKRIFESQAKFSPKSKVAQRLKLTFDYLDQAFPHRSNILRNRSVIQAFCSLTAQIVVSPKARGREQRLREFFEHFMKELARQVELGQQATDLDYVSFQKTVSANTSAGAQTRHTVLMRKLLMFDPTFADCLELPHFASAGLNTAVGEAGKRVANLVTELNRASASSDGQDLIKPTNKVMEAVGRLGVTVGDLDGYRRFVDDLYFVFWEGPGERLSHDRPASFRDVNDLRTGLRHDLDHGKASRTRARRVEIGDTFERYAGGRVPETLAPERFPIAQLSILNELEKDLRQLLAKY